MIGWLKKPHNISLPTHLNEKKLDVLLNLHFVRPCAWKNVKISLRYDTKFHCKFHRISIILKDIKTLNLGHSTHSNFSKIFLNMSKINQYLQQQLTSKDATGNLGITYVWEKGSTNIASLGINNIKLWSWPSIKAHFKYLI